MSTYSNFLSSNNVEIFSRGIIPFTPNASCREDIQDYEVILNGVSYMSDWLIVGIVFSSIFTFISLGECIFGIVSFSSLPASEETKVRFGISVFPMDSTNDIFPEGARISKNL
jgi:hypothetical protein